MTSQLRSLSVVFAGDSSIKVRVAYTRRGGPNPGTLARRKEVTALARAGLEGALAALDTGAVEVVGESGFEIREDVLCASAKREEKAS